MGTFGTGFLQSLGNAAHAKVERQHELEMEQKKNELAFQRANLAAAMQRGGEMRPDPSDPSKQVWYNYTPEDYMNQHQQYADNASKVYGNTPAIKQIYQKAQQAIGAATGHPLWGHPGSENLPPSQGGTQGTTTGNTPVTQTSAVPGVPGIPAPPGASAGGASPNPALPSTPTGSLEGKSASDADPQGISGTVPPVPDSPPSASSSAAPDPDSSMAPPAPGTSGTLESMLLPADGPTKDADAGTSATPSAAAIPKNIGAGAIPPPPTAALTRPIGQMAQATPTADQMLNTHLSPYQAAQLQQEVTLRQKQQIFEQEQAQLQTKLANLSKALGRPLTSEETLMATGIRFPASYGQIKFDGQTVQGENLPSNAIGTDGQPLSGNVANGTTWQAAGMRSGRPMYLPVDPTLHEFTQANLPTNYNPKQGSISAPINSTPVKLGTSNTTLAPISGVIDGQTVQLPGRRTSTPLTGNTPPMGSQGQGYSSPSTMPGAPSATPLPPGRATSKASGGVSAMPPVSSPTGTSPVSAPGGRVMPRGFVQMGQATAQGKAYSAVMDPYRQIFGDPDVPGIPSVSKYAYLADDPKAANDIGTAVKLSMQGLDEVGEKGGGIFTMFRNLGGLPSLETSANAQAINQAVQNLTPIEREAYDRQMQMIGTLVGLRAITSASAAQGSVRTIMNEAPMFGINVADSKEFNRRLAGFAQQMYTASAKSPIFTTADRNMFKDEAQNMAKLGYGDRSKVPAPPSGNGSPKYFDVIDPNHHTHHFKTKSEADNFRKLAGITQ